MDNREIASALKLTSKLMDLNGENEFKVRSYVNASFRIERLEKQLSELSLEEIGNIEGIGKGIVSKISELNETGGLQELNRLLEITPPGVVKMMGIKGIGPKKAGIIWNQMGIETIGELLYACNENRLVKVKGFGEKTQEQIKQALLFTISNTGKFHWAALENITDTIINAFKSQGIELVEATGEMRRQCDIVDKIEIVIGAAYSINKITFLQEMGFKPKLDEKGTLVNDDGIKLKLHFCTKEMFPGVMVQTTGNEAHLSSLKELGFRLENPTNTSEESIYANIELDYIPPPMREGLDEIQMAKAHKIPELVSLKDIKGILHCHSTYSDGLKSLEVMAARCKELGYEYLGISDHSQSAFYANGLKPDRIIEQDKEIDLLNEKLFPFHIYKGIESDILGDGSLDYEERVLKSFDFIIASVHSNLKMTEEKATARIMGAVQNPYTTILGHPTSRLLLAREGYPLDHKAIIDACAKNKVIIELNANPFRLDIDWRWIQYAIKQGVMISINPDSHSLEGLNDVKYGVNVAQKGGLTKLMTFNALSREEIGQYFSKRKANL